MTAGREPAYVPLAWVKTDEVPRRFGEPPMEIADWKSTEKYNDIYRKIRELDLEQNVSELDAYGFTIVPKDKVASDEVRERLTTAVLRIAGERTGIEHALESNGNRGQYDTQPHKDNQYLLFYLLMEDRVFEEWLLNPTMITLARYLMDDMVQLSSMTSFVKWKGTWQESEPNEQPPANTMGLHSDSPGSSRGNLPQGYANVCNSAYCLTDYTRRDGAIAMVPGSHHWARQPRPGEGEDQAIPVEAPAGSLIVWHGNTWHGAFPKQTDGLRLNLTTYMCNSALKTQERYQRDIPQAMLDRNPPEFAELVGANDPMGWEMHGPDIEKFMKLAKSTVNDEYGEGARVS